MIDEGAPGRPGLGLEVRAEVSVMTETNVPASELRDHHDIIMGAAVVDGASLLSMLDQAGVAALIYHCWEIGSRRVPAVWRWAGEVARGRHGERGDVAGVDERVRWCAAGEGRTLMIFMPRAEALAWMTAHRPGDLLAQALLGEARGGAGPAPDGRVEPGERARSGRVAGGVGPRGRSRWHR